jgi:spore cortex biosynthesis protein YabQ
METTAPQPFIFMFTIYGGMLVGIAYDFYRLVRKAVKRGRWVTALLDTLFIITLGFIVVFVMYMANQGDLRLYMFAGFALGFALHIAGISPFIQFIIKKVSQRIRKGKSK